MGLFNMIPFICGDTEECSPSLFPPALKFLFSAVTAYSGEVEGKVIWTGVTWLSGFPGTSCGLNFSRLVVTFLLSCHPICPQSGDAHNCFDTLSWRRSCQKRNFYSAYAINNETVFMSRVGSHGNSDVFAERLITVMLVNEVLQRAGAAWWLIPSTCGRHWGDAWFRRAYHSLLFLNYAAHEATAFTTIRAEQILSVLFRSDSD